ncbi:MAG TPA: hypothetical protein VLT81_00565 [Chondromyces sp.]|nr:hypothetical protein [Chondromyces sp.]
MKQQRDTPVTDGRPTRTGGEQTAKRPYRPPQIVSRSALEAIAVACSPQPPGKVTLASCGLEKS